MTSSAGAQSTFASNGTLASAYVFRGLTLTNTPTLQPKLAVSTPVAGGTLSAWGWGNLEAAVPSSPNALSEGGGVSGINEIDLVAQFNRPFGELQLTAGTTRYVFSGHNRVFTPAFNTTEVFLGLRGDKLPFAPSVVANWDVQTIHGVYAEASVSQVVHLGEAAPVIGVLAGWSMGQEQRNVDDGYFAFAQRGLTHLDVSAAHSITMRAISVTPALHVQWSPPGQNTRAVGALPSAALHATKLWFALDLGWSKASVSDGER